MPKVGKNIYLRKDGRYEGRYIAARDENGKPRYASVYGRTVHEVEAKLAEVKVKLREEFSDETIRFSDAVTEWLEDRRKHLAAATTDRYEYFLYRYFVPEFGDRDINSITDIEINAFIVGLADKDKYGDNAIGGTTIENLRSIAGSVVSFARKNKQEYQSLRSMVKIERDSYEPLDSDEIRRLVSCAKYNRNPEMLGVMLTLFTGIGTGELCALSWDDFDLPRREIYIKHTLYRIKNKDGGKKRTKLAVTDVRKSAIRTVQYPQELDSYVRELYHKGCVFLTGDKEKFLEQRSFANHLESMIKGHGLSGLTLQRVKKTHDKGLADIRYISDPYYEKQNSSKAQVQVRLDERWLIKEMENDLRPLRNILGISSYEMGAVMGISEDDYKAIEAGEAVMDWDLFLSLLFFFKYNSKTESVVDALGLYPNALQERLEIRN